MFDKEKLKQAMDDHGDTNKALAVFLGMTASNFSTIWNGRQPFQRKHIVRIAVRYQLSPQDVWDIFFLADAEAIKKEGAVALTCGSSFHILNTKRRASKSPAFVV